MSPRVLIWVLAQLHLLFAAFVLAVPMFAWIVEVLGLLQPKPEDRRRYDTAARELLRISTTAFSLTALLGTVFAFALIGLYPALMSRMVDVFGPSLYLYALLAFAEAFSMYLYYYGWDRFRNRWAHAGVGLLLNASGVLLMLVANAWTTFMMAPSGLGPDGAIVSRWDAFFNPLLFPIHTHRLIANLCMGGSVAAAYAATRYLSARNDQERAYYDWLGYVGNLVAVVALLPLPFAGYWLGYEIYQYNQQLGIYMMGGVLSWLFILQAVLIGALFFAANYYLWTGMDRIEGAERYRGWIKVLLGVITVCVAVWATPKSLLLTAADLRLMGGTSHPVFGLLGVMSAKNTAVNIMILTTFLSFVLYRRANKQATVWWAPWGKAAQAMAFGAASAVVLVIGVGGYLPSLWMEASKRVAMSPYQVAAVLACMLVVLAIDLPLYRGARSLGAIRWGTAPRRSQYALIFLAVTFTWLMGLMGFARSALRQHWHIYEVMRDTSDQAYTPALGEAALVVSLVVLLFFGLVAGVFWLAAPASIKLDTTVRDD